MKKFKLTAILIVLAMLFTLVACGSDDDAVSDEVNSGSGEDAAGLRIVIVTSGSSVDDGSFNQDNYEGIRDFILEYPDATVTAVTSPEIADSMTDVEAVIADYDVIVTPGFQFAEISSLAVENPEKYFILVDSEPTPIGDQTTFGNIYSMLFKEQESGFFAGIAAALETTTDKVAFIGGIAYPSVVNYQFGFDAGVKYANDNLGASAEIINLPAYAGTDVTGADVGGNYVGDFGDPATGKVIAEALIAEGADIIFIAAGFSGTGGFTAAMEATDVMVVGCDVDQYSDGTYADGNIVLTSGLKNMRINVYRQLKAIADGTFSGGNYLLGADTDSTGFVSADGRQQLSADTLSVLNDAYAKVKSGELAPPGNFDPGNLPR